MRLAQIGVMTAFLALLGVSYANVRREGWPPEHLRIDAARDVPGPPRRECVNLAETGENPPSISGRHCCFLIDAYEWRGEYGEFWRLEGCEER